MNNISEILPSSQQSDKTDENPDAETCLSAPFEINAHDHHFTFYSRGHDRLDALIKHIASARESLHAFYFLYEPDAAGRKVRDALIEAAKRGVDTCLYIDAFGSGAEDEFFDSLIAAGGRFKQFSASWNVQFLIRNHQKMAIADRKRVMGGGFNISDEYFAPLEQNGWCDLGVMIEGPIVERFNEWFDCVEEWIQSDGSELRKIQAMVRDWDPGTGPVQLIMGGPTAVSSDWAVRFKQDLTRSKRTDLVTAYFSPPRTMRRVLRKAARNSKLRMILASKSDMAVTVLAARLHYKRLGKAGAKVVEFQPSKLHMKLLVTDDITYFGSGNLDMRSVRLNLEMMVRVEDAALAAKMRELIDGLERSSAPIDKKWRKLHAGPTNWLRWVISSFMLRAVDYNLARRFNLGPTKLRNVRPRRGD